MLKSFYYKNQFWNSKIDFLITEFPCITVTTGIHNFMQVKDAYEYMHVHRVPKLATPLEIS